MWSEAEGGGWAVSFAARLTVLAPSPPSIRHDLEPVRIRLAFIVNASFASHFHVFVVISNELLSTVRLRQGVTVHKSH